MLNQSSELSEQELLRYSRHLTLAEIGLAGQQRLKQSSALVIGAGGLGSPAILYLAAAGVGRIGIADFDSVEFSNLQRQILYGSADVGGSKVDLACQKGKSLNSEIELVPHVGQVTAANVMDLIVNYDVIVDGTDNFATRYLINDACVLANKPNVYGAIHRFEGQASVFLPKVGPCYRCIFPVPPSAHEMPNCAEAGVLGVLPGLVGVIQAAESLKLLLGKGDSLVGRLLMIDVMAMSFKQIRVKRDLKCTLCGDNAAITELGPAQLQQVCEGQPDTDVTSQALRAEVESGQSLIFLDVRELDEFERSHMENSKHIPLKQLAGRLSELPLESEIVVYCQKGVRSQAAAQILRQAGHSKVRTLKGGFETW